MRDDLGGLGEEIALGKNQPFVQPGETPQKMSSFVHVENSRQNCVAVSERRQLLGLICRHRADYDGIVQALDIPAFERQCLRSTALRQP
jgi:hypothetical protein